MKNIIRVSTILLLAILINSFIPFVMPMNSVAIANGLLDVPGLDHNILMFDHISFGLDGSGAGIVDQALYTKLIKLDGYNQKNISGKLHFEVVPDYSIKIPKKYTVLGPSHTDYMDDKVNVTIRTGIVRGFEYEVPFSSNDFVDPEFNNLCKKASTDFGLKWESINTHKPPENYKPENAKTYIDLFNHAFLHQWGTVITPDDSYYRDNNPKIYRVGKVMQHHFTTIQDYLNYVNYMNENHLWIKKWGNDPETYISGYGSDWSKNNSLDGEEKYGRPLKSASANEEHLSKDPSFRDGSMKFTEKYTKKYLNDSFGPETRRDRLYTITRPIAISKTYDSKGNITSLEKPLFPTDQMTKFYNDHSIYYNRDGNKDTSYSHLEVYRYILREKQSTGVPLRCEYEPYIMDVVYTDKYLGEGKIYIYKKGKESDYKNYFRNTPLLSTVNFGPFANEVSKGIQSISTYGEPLPEPSPIPVPESSEPGDGAKDLLSDNINFGPANFGMGIIDQVWYTKWIDLRGYRGKDIKGTLHFELVPDNTAKEEYTVHGPRYNEEDPDDPFNAYNIITVKVVPGIMTYKYKTPFSSDDFVDEEFVKLVTDARSDFVYTGNKGKKTVDDICYERMVKLFNHAFLHEWGTILTSDKSTAYRVGKVLPSHFTSPEKYNAYCNSMENSNQWVDWENDPEKDVTGYVANIQGYNLENEAKADRPLVRDDESVLKHMATIPSFLTGKMKFTDELIGTDKGVTYMLYGLTRNIAVSKTYDAAGNITSIEKPLFPSMPLLDFYAKHNAKLFPDDFYDNGGPIKDIDKRDYVFRYILREKDVTGVDITPTDEEIIVEVAYQREYAYHEPQIRMYRNEKKAKENHYTYRTKSYSMKPMVKETTERIRLANRLNAPVYPKTGDNNTIYLYVALIGIALITTIFVVRKRKTN